MNATRSPSTRCVWLSSSRRLLGCQWGNIQLLHSAHTRATQLQAALTNRAVIDQAIGIVRSRSGGSADEAFGRLRQISQTENVKLAVIAQRLVDEAVHRVRARGGAADRTNATRRRGHRTSR